MILVACTLAEVRGFIHIFPKTIEWYLIVNLVQVCLEPFLSLRVSEIGVSGIIGPHLTDEGLTINGCEETIFFSIIVGLVITTWSVCNTGIKDWYISSVSSVEILDEIWETVESISVVLEVTVLVKPVDI